MAFHLRILFPPVKIGYRHQRSRSHWPLLLRPKALPPSASTYPSMSGYRLHTVFRDQMDAWPGSFTYSSVSSPAKKRQPVSGHLGLVSLSRYIYPMSLPSSICFDTMQPPLWGSSWTHSSHPAHTRPSCTMRPFSQKDGVPGLH